jgi:Xaa-Pro aminopeptidase
MNPYAEKLALLRAAMKENNIDAYIIPSIDPHPGEYIPDHWRIIAWLTGFTGSAATVVVTDSFAGLWTDYRYLIQAENQLVCQFL